MQIASIISRSVYKLDSNKLATMEEMIISNRGQIALDLLKTIVTLPGSYTEEELALISLTIADHLLENLSKPSSAIRSRLQSIQKSKKAG